MRIDTTEIAPSGKSGVTLHTCREELEIMRSLADRALTYALVHQLQPADLERLKNIGRALNQAINGPVGRLDMSPGRAKSKEKKGRPRTVRLPLNLKLIWEHLNTPLANTDEAVDRLEKLRELFVVTMNNDERRLDRPLANIRPAAQTSP